MSTQDVKLWFEIMNQGEVEESYCKKLDVYENIANIINIGK